MAESLYLAFRGSLPAQALPPAQDKSIASAVAELEREAAKIAEEIAGELSTLAGQPAKVVIRFREGSVEWFGHVELSTAMWGTVEAMADLGGAVALVQLVAPAINDVLRRWFARVFGGARSIPPLDTRVVLLPSLAVTAARRPPAPWYRFPAVLVGVGVLLAGLAALFSATGGGLLPGTGGKVDSSQLLVILVSIASALAAGIMFAMFRGEPFDRFEMSRLYFAAGTLAVLSFLFLLSMIFYAVGPAPASPGGESPGKVVFEACVKVIPPIVTLIIGFYFGAQQRSSDAGEPAAPRAAGGGGAARRG